MKSIVTLNKNGNIRKKRNPNFDLEKMGLLGKYIEYVPCSNCFTGTYVKVVGKNVIEYNGETITMQEFNKQHNKYHRIGTKTKEFQSSNYFAYKRKMIDDLWYDFCNGKSLDLTNIKTNEKQDKSGYVYVFKNPSFNASWVKIGKSNNWKRRIKELSSSTSIPTEFEPVIIIKVNDMNSVEAYVHHTIGCLCERINNKREFFLVDEEKIKKFMTYIVSDLFKNNAEIVNLVP